MVIKVGERPNFKESGRYVEAVGLRQETLGRFEHAVDGQVIYPRLNIDGRPDVHGLVFEMLEAVYVNKGNNQSVVFRPNTVWVQSA